MPDIAQELRSVSICRGELRPSGAFIPQVRAVTFVMENLHEAERATAVIAIEQMPGKLPLGRIEEIHATLTTG